MVSPFVEDTVAVPFIFQSGMNRRAGSSMPKASSAGANTAWPSLIHIGPRPCGIRCAISARSCQYIQDFVSVPWGAFWASSPDFQNVTKPHFSELPITRSSSRDHTSM